MIDSLWFWAADRAPLEVLFPVSPQPELQLPAAFDDTCKFCDKSMERMPLCAWTRRRPYAVFQCTECKVRLMLFETPRAPFLIWSTEFRNRREWDYTQFTFSELIDRAIEEHERRHAARKG